jgi:hypothetical protein
MKTRSGAATSASNTLEVVRKIDLRPSS